MEDSLLADTTFLVNEASLLGLIGLHTCGNLASSSLRLFVANPRVHFLCNVGCCYHLLEEEFSRNTYNQRKAPNGDGAPQTIVPVCEEKCEGKHTGVEHIPSKQEYSALLSSASLGEREMHSSHAIRESAVPPTTEREEHWLHEQSSREEQQQEPPVTGTASRGSQGEGDIDPLHPSRIPNLGQGFPLSSFLRGRQFSLGRNSRMLSSQATDRLTQGNLGGPDSLYWRALLQVVLVDKLGDVSELSHVGRLSGKCQTFTEYAVMAMARLGVSVNVTKEELEEYDKKYRSTRDKLERFFLLRASMAAVVEGAMLLDRLAFLCEQEDVSAYLVPLFDPVTSPRCHALLAVRGTSSPRH
ncbi:Methyltransferase-like protein 25 [Portunus trituberculatus]|uniref:Methyltransferase-like protein 25 n=1 Tax=Portunus trituberculatus TaxID=210409 RepID=A0A5B7GG09_PORTR|nr:Methyltransferase-like protein 25 [Portunus trituberculatus]